MGRKSRIRHGAAATIALTPHAEQRNRASLERDDTQRYYDRVRTELTMQRGLI